METEDFCSLPVQVAQGSAFQAASDQISTETPIALVYNGISHVVLMATPGNWRELALGFSLSEGIIDSIDQVYDMGMQAGCDGLVVGLDIAAAAFQRLKSRRRQMSGRTGCGLCGLDSLEAVKPQLPPVFRQHRIGMDAVVAALAHFDAGQILRARTGSVHGAAWADRCGNIRATFEDVGRHNALDKLIGWGMQNRTDWADGFVLLSSRASFEMVMKSAVAGIGCMAAVSAATSYAVGLAEQTGITLIGFARPKRQVIYTHAEWLLPQNTGDTEQEDANRNQHSDSLAAHSGSNPCWAEQ